MLRRFAPMLICCALAAPLFAKPRVEPPVRTPLDEYVAEVDPAFAWKVVKRIPAPTHDTLVVDLTSQTWRSSDEVSRTDWKHWLTIVVPKEVGSETAMLFIGGGSNDDGPPDAADERSVGVAVGTKTVVVNLPTVPNQPLRVLGSKAPQRDRYEDDLLAASWIQFMETKDPTWLAQLPMAKSAVAAMEATQQVLAAEPNGPAVKNFTVAGGSKRGWTTWLAAITDDRVAAIAPIVIDMLNIEPSMKHHRAVYGFWSEALGDYEGQGLADSLTSPEAKAIRAIVDPYSYRERLTLPKCLINASGDEFFLPDSSRFYFDDLVGEKHLSYTPNAGHSLRGSNALDTLLAFHASVAYGLDRPTVTWSAADTHDAPQRIVRCSAEPVEAVLWRAVNAEARDFRYPVIADAYEPMPLKPEADGSYRVPIEAPAKGYAAAFVRFTFDIGAPKPFRISTPVWISPDVEPFAE